MPRRSSVIQSINFSVPELAQLLIELHAEGENLPPGAFDELAEATLHAHTEASRAVLEASDAQAKLCLGLTLAREILSMQASRSRFAYEA